MIQDFTLRCHSGTRLSQTSVYYIKTCTNLSGLNDGRIGYLHKVCDARLVALRYIFIFEIFNGDYMHVT